MTATTASSPAGAVLAAEHHEAQLRFEIHWSVCRARLAGQDCIKCERLDEAAWAAEQRLTAAQGGR